MVNTEKEDRARAELVKLAADNDMYFVIWWGHFDNYFVGVRNERGRKPEIYKAVYESFYDLTDDDEVIFRFPFKVNDDSSEICFSWIELLQEAIPAVVKSIVKNLGSKRKNQ